MAPYIWGGIAVLLALLEIFVLDFTFLLLAVAAGGTALVATAGAPVTVQVAVFTGLALIGIFAIRPIARKHMMRQVPPTATNVDALVGKTAKTTSEVTIDGGQVHLNGEDWSARVDTDIDTGPIPSGARVVVTRIDGATAIVARQPSESLTN